MDCECESSVHRPLEAGARNPQGVPSLALAPLAVGVPMPMEGPEAARNAFRCLSTMPLVGFLAPSFAVSMPCAATAPETFEDFSNGADEKFETASYASTG